MSRAVTTALGLVVIAVLALSAMVVVVTLGGDDDPRTTAATARPDSQRLSAPADSQATFVEFLDFECEACGALYPTVERLREAYGERITFVVRYFPLPGHVNGDRAARAVASAAEQGRFEDMYRTMFETQRQWGEQQVPLDDLFASYASELGLDMSRYARDYTSQAIRARIDSDIADGQALGVRGTPTFFLDDAPVKPGTYAEMSSVLTDALRR